VLAVRSPVCLLGNPAGGAVDGGDGGVAARTVAGVAIRALISNPRLPAAASAVAGPVEGATPVLVAVDVPPVK
jgi:hypothetical protein